MYCNSCNFMEVKTQTMNNGKLIRHLYCRIRKLMLKHEVVTDIVETEGEPETKTHIEHHEKYCEAQIPGALKVVLDTR